VIVQIINRFREKKTMGRAELIRVAQYQGDPITYGLWPELD
jgi:hypothetical protein